MGSLALCHGGSILFLRIIPSYHQATADTLRDRVALLLRIQQRLQAAIETFVQDCVTAMELDTEKR